MIYLILLVGLFFRLISSNQSLWLDESTSALASSIPLKDFFLNFLPGDFHPPLYYLILRFWIIVFGDSEFSLRLPSILFGVATIFIVYKISKSRTAALFTASSSLLIYYSQEARMYSLLTLLTTLCVYFYQNRNWKLLSISVLLTGMTDYIGLLILPVLMIDGYKNIKNVLKTFIPLGLFFMLFSSIFITQLLGASAVENTPWWGILGQLSLKNILLIPTKFLLGRISFNDQMVYLSIVATGCIIAIYLLYKSLHSPRLYWLWLFVPLLLGLIISIKIPVLSYFRFVFCLPALYILFAKANVRKVFFLLIMAINVLSSGYYLLNKKFHRENWRSAAHTIGSEKIILPSNSQKEALIYYKKQDNIVQLSDLSENDQKIWLSRYVWEIFDPLDSTRIKLDELGYNKTSEHNFNGVLFFLYTKKLNENRD